MVSAIAAEITRPVEERSSTPSRKCRIIRSARSAAAEEPRSADVLPTLGPKIASRMLRTTHEQTVSTAGELVERITRLAPETAVRLKPLLAALQQNEGEPVRKLVGNYRPPTIPKVERGRSPRRRKG